MYTIQTPIRIQSLHAYMKLSWDEFKDYNLEELATLKTKEKKTEIEGVPVKKRNVKDFIEDGYETLARASNPRHSIVNHAFPGKDYEVKDGNKFIIRGENVGNRPKTRRGKNRFYRVGISRVEVDDVDDVILLVRLYWDAGSADEYRLMKKQ